MKRVVLFAVVFATGLSVNAQIGSIIKNRVKEKTEEHVTKKVGEAFDRAVDSSKEQTPESDQEPIEGWTCPACGYGGNTGKFCAECGAKQSDNANNAATDKQKNDLEMTYAKCDFVAGDDIIFEDPMDGETLGEFPSQWDLIGGVAEVASINGKKAICFVDNSSSTKIEPLMKNPKAYLPEIFTIEFDFFIKDKSDKSHYHPYLVGDVMDRTDEDLLHVAMFGNGRGEYSAYKPDKSDVGGTFDFSDGIKEGDWNHFALSFNKRACKVYINGVRYVNIPNMQAPKRFRVDGSWWNDTPSEYITNIRIAQGAVPLYDRMMTDGKFITYGITFDVNKSVIKPESMGEINRIVQLMNENPTLKFSVEGHTDASGNAANNQKLSEARANAIVDKLVELGIAKDRLTAVGKGHTSPIADNNSDEGRAKNRRVEFVKQ